MVWNDPTSQGHIDVGGLDTIGSSAKFEPCRVAIVENPKIIGFRQRQKFPTATITLCVGARRRTPAGIRSIKVAPDEGPVDLEVAKVRRNVSPALLKIPVKVINIPPARRRMIEIEKEEIFKFRTDANGEENGCGIESTLFTKLPEAKGDVTVLNTITNINSGFPTKILVTVVAPEMNQIAARAIVSVDFLEKENLHPFLNHIHPYDR